MSKFFKKLLRNSQQNSQNLPNNDSEPHDYHYINGLPLNISAPIGYEEIILGMGCFWGPERLFWQTQGILTTAVGYSGGNTKNPTYDTVCSGLTNHNEVVKLIFNEKEISLKTILKLFWENHDPTQGMRQGNDIGTQYRSGVYCKNSTQLNMARESKIKYQEMLNKVGIGLITTEIVVASDFFFAESYHQQYLAKNPNGYCGAGGTGVLFE